MRYKRQNECRYKEHECGMNFFSEPFLGFNNAKLVYLFRLYFLLKNDG